MRKKIAERADLLPKFILALSDRGEGYLVDYFTTFEIKALCKEIKLYINDTNKCPKMNIKSNIPR